MELYFLLAISIGALVLAGLGVMLALRPARIDDSPELAGKRPQGYWMGVGIAFGLLAGYILTFIAGILSRDWQFFIILGPAMGMVFGLAFGVALEQRHKDEIRPLTAAEQRARRWAMWAGVALVGLGLLVLAGIILLAG